MPRKARLFVPSATYHVYCRVARGEFVFEEVHNSEIFLDTLRDVRDRDQLSVLAWCLMSNHYHLVIKTASIPLWRSMARLQGKTAREHNRSRGVLGRLWQSRYRARLIDSNEYFRQVVAYVHLNPVAAGLVEDPSDYPLSGHREAIGRRRPTTLDVIDLLTVFGPGDPDQRRAEYLRSVRLVAEERWFNEGLANLPWWQDADDKEEVVSPRRNRRVETWDQKRRTEDRVHLELHSLLTGFERVTGISGSDLQSSRRGPVLPDARADLTALAVGRFEHRVSDVAKLLKKNPGTVSRWLTKADRRSQQDPTYQPYLDTLESKITAFATAKVIK